jgi:hypothetical protein
MRDPPNFLYVVLDRTACAPFYTERRIGCREPTKLRKKSGTPGAPIILFQEVLTQTLKPSLAEALYGTASSSASTSTSLSVLGGRSSCF